jgi:glycosyltransferase involved in cell wall biosynthesis
MESLGVQFSDASDRHGDSSLLMTRQRVLIDGYFLGRPFGMGRCILELCRALGQFRTEVEFIIAVPSKVDASLLETYPNVSWHPLPSRNRVIWEQLLIPKLARRLSCDVIHFPFNTTALYTYGIPTVTTVHDIIFLGHKGRIRKPKDFFVINYIKLAFTHGTKKANAVVSVSRTTQELLQQLGLQSTAIYNTSDGFLSSTQACTPPISQRRYILHRGGSAEHRNTKRVIDAFRNAQDGLADVDLKILGVPAEFASKWVGPEDEHIHFVPRLSDCELAALYRGSSCVIVASLQEGFGLPIIEAFGFGVPVITSRIDPMMEIAGDAAILIDPLSVPDISRAMAAVLSDPVLAQSLTARGTIRSMLFTSDRLAEQMLDVYQKAAARP